MNTIEKRETQIIRAIVIWIPVLLLLLSPMRAKAQQVARKLAKWHPTQDLIAVTDAFNIELYNSDFVLLDQIEVVSDPTPQIRSGGMEWSPDGSKLALVVVGVDFDPTGSALLIWDMTNFQLLTQIPSVLPAFTPMAWNPAGTRLAVIHSPGFAQDVVRIYDAISGVLLSESSHSSARRNITQIAWSPDGSQIAFEEQGEVQIWNVETSQPINTLSSDIDNEVDLLYSPTTNQLAYVDISNSSNILIWNTTSFLPIRTLQGHTESIRAFAWGSGGIASTSFDDTTRVWDPETGGAIAVFQTGVTSTPSWNPAGTLYVTTSSDIGVHIRDATTGEVVTTLNNPTQNQPPLPTQILLDSRDCIPISRHTHNCRTTRGCGRHLGRLHLRHRPHH